MAGRIRTIKPELHEQARFAALSDGAHRLFVGLTSLADDLGNCPADPTFLARVFYGRPRSMAVIAKLVDELHEARLIDLYTVLNERYLAVVGWRERGSPTYQRIDKPQGPKFPQPTSVRSWNGPSALDGGTDPNRSETIREGEPARASAIPPSTEPVAEHRSGEPVPHATQQGADTPDQVSRPAIGNVAKPQRAPTPDRSTHATGSVPLQEYSRQPSARTPAESAPSDPIVGMDTKTAAENIRAYNPDDPRARGRLAEATYRRVSEARVAIAAELGLARELPLQPITPSTIPPGFRDLSERIMQEGALAPAAVEIVVANLIAQARRDRSVEWLGAKAFGVKAWEHSRSATPPTRRDRSVPAKSDPVIRVPNRPEFSAPPARVSAADRAAAAEELRRAPEVLAALAASDRSRHRLGPGSSAPTTNFTDDESNEQE